MRIQPAQTSAKNTVAVLQREKLDSRNVKSPSRNGAGCAVVNIFEDRVDVGWIRRSVIAPAIRPPIVGP